MIPSNTVDTGDVLGDLLLNGDGEKIDRKNQSTFRKCSIIIGLQPGDTMQTGISVPAKLYTGRK